MATVSATEARKRLYALIDEVGQSHTSRCRSPASAATLCCSSILEGMATEVSELSSEPLW
jgi:hypothetical protein